MPLVLVVDDEPDIRELMQLNLEMAGYRVITAADGKQALAAVQRETPDARTACGVASRVRSAISPSHSTKLPDMIARAIGPGAP